MKAEELLEAIGSINDKTIHDAKEDRPLPTYKWVKWVAVAACLSLSVYASILFLPSDILKPGPEEPGPGQEKPAPGWEELPSNGMGYEGIMVYSISEIGGANPWTEDSSLSTLPVYKNLAYTDRAGTPICLSESAMLALAEKAAAALGTKTGEIEVEPYFGPAEEYKDMVSSLYATTDIGTIEVDGNGQIDVWFDKPVQLPKEYRFTRSGTSDDEAVRVTSYLLERFSRLLELESPVIDTRIDYDYSGKQRRNYYAYSDSDNLEQRILNYNFNKVEFAPDEKGALLLIRYGNVLSCAEKLGDCPVISLEAARGLLLDGKYLSTVPAELLYGGAIREQDITKAELVYGSNNLYKVFMPYYRFYIELSEDGEIADGLINYGAFYVPAISSEYLSELSVWDGSFN